MAKKPPVPAELLDKIRLSIADSYELDYFLVHQDRYRIILNRIASLNLPPKSRILDVGCFPLHIFTALQMMGYSVYGISSTHEPIHTSTIKSLNIEIDELPYRDDTFDVILFSEVMEHLVVNPLEYLAKFHRILKPDGRLIITTPNAAGLHKLTPLIFGRSTYFPLSDVYNTRHGDGSIYMRHNREYTRAELSEILQRASFSVTKKQFIGVYGPFRKKVHPHPPVKRFMRGVAFFITMIIPRFRDTLYIEAVPIR